MCQKRLVCAPKETGVCAKRDWYVCRKRLMYVPKEIDMSMCVPRETDMCATNTRYVCQKRPVCVPKETDMCAKRDHYVSIETYQRLTVCPYVSKETFIRQNKPTCVPKETRTNPSKTECMSIRVKKIICIEHAALIVSKETCTCKKRPTKKTSKRVLQNKQGNFWARPSAQIFGGHGPIYVKRELYVSK